MAYYWRLVFSKSLVMKTSSKSDVKKVPDKIRKPRSLTKWEKNQGLVPPKLKKDNIPAENLELMGSGKRQDDN